MLALPLRLVSAEIGAGASIVTGADITTGAAIAAGDGITAGDVMIAGEIAAGASMLCIFSLSVTIDGGIEKRGICPCPLPFPLLLPFPLRNDEPISVRSASMSMVRL